jgi:hypothetical protein
LASASAETIKIVIPVMCSVAVVFIRALTFAGLWIVGIDCWIETFQTFFLSWLDDIIVDSQVARIVVVKIQIVNIVASAFEPPHCDISKLLPDMPETMETTILVVKSIKTCAP